MAIKMFQNYNEKERERQDTKHKNKKLNVCDI